MNILAIDIGSYSIKFIEVRPERKNLYLIEKQEIILDEAKTHYPNAEQISDLQKEIITAYIQKKSQEMKIIFQLPNDMLTTRYLEIPGTSKRKTEQIIPFQLDESLPYSLSNAHFSSRIYKRPGGFSVLSNITQINLFKEFFKYFENKDSQPSILTSEISTIQAYIDYIRMNDICCILDLGHKTTKAYFVQDRQIVANHTSHVAGEAINEVISKTYQVSYEDAVIYKHENAFLLTDDQLLEVSPDQKEFALLMKKVFSPFILDLKRWEIGHRIKFGTSIDKIYIFGGSSQINSLDNFFNYHTGLPVEFLPPLNDLKDDFAIYDKNFYLAKMMALSQKVPNGLINFLSGKFQTASNAFISIHSAVFIWVRSTFIALLLILGLFSERFFFLAKEEKEMDRISVGLLKTPSLGISKSEQNIFHTKPEKLLSILRKKNKMAKDEVISILSSNNISAIRPLALLSKAINSNTKVSLLKFSNSGPVINAIFTSDDPMELETMSKRLLEVGLPDIKINYVNGKNSLSIEFTDRG